MRSTVQLYINNERVDLFDFEDINIVDTIQDVRDVGKIFIPFSREFSVPASKNNNKLFKHYYNNEIINGFDARFKISAEIRINNIVYKKGRVVLTGSQLTNNRPSKYKLVFYSSTVDLKNLIGDDMLSALGGELSDYNLEYTAENVNYGLSFGYNFTNGSLQYLTPFPLDDKDNPKDLIIPFISTSSYYYFDSDVPSVSPISGSTASRNINSLETNGFRGINWKDLRPSLRLPIIINAIESKYGISFSGNFLSQSIEEFNRLYLWLNNDKGIYGEEKTLIELLSDFTLTTGNELLPLIAVGSNVGPVQEATYYKVFLTIETDDVNDEYNVIIRDRISGDDLVNRGVIGDSLTEVFLFATEVSFFETTREYDLQIEVNGVQSASISMNAKIQKWYDAGRNSSPVLQEESFYDYVDVSTDAVFNIGNNMPKIKVIDFLTGIFKMFNLTAYVDLNDNVIVETLDDYYTNGTTIDVSKYIKTDNIDVNKNKLYSKIDFEFDKPKTFATINSNELRPDEFGNERIDNTNDDPVLKGILAFDGGKYKVNPKFEKMQYERMTDQTGGADTLICWGWCVTDSQNETVTAPVLHYAENIDLTNEPYTIGLDPTAGFDVDIYRYYRPSNSLSNASIHRQSLHFGSEYDEFYNDIGSNEVSLFNRYWKNYIISIYKENSRLTILEGIFPTSLITTIELNDVLVINRKKYRINKLDVNITTGKTKLELVTYREIVPYYGLTVDTDTYTVDTNTITVDKIR